MSTPRFLAPLVVMLTALGACAAPPVAFSVNGVVLDRSEVQVEVGQSLALTAAVDTVGTGDASVSWSSSDAAVVSVDAAGLVAGVSPGGPVTVTATSIADNGKSASVLVTVVPAATPTVPFTVSAVSVTPDTGELYVGANLTVDASVSATGTGDTSVVWSSNAESVATVAGGVVSGVAVGFATITATSVANPSRSASAFVEVRAVPAAASFTMFVEDPSLSVYKPAAPQTRSTVVTVTRDPGFTGLVSVDVDPATVPAGVTATVTAGLAAGNSASWNLSLAVDGTVAAGLYPITVRATDGAITRTATLTLAVATWRFGVTPGDFSVAAGQPVTLTLQIESTGIAGKILNLNAVTFGNPRWRAQFEALVAADGFSVAPASVGVAADGTMTATVTITLPATAAPGKYRFKLALELDGIRVVQDGRLQMTVY